MMSWICFYRIFQPFKKVGGKSEEMRLASQ